MAEEKSKDLRDRLKLLTDGGKAEMKRNIEEIYRECFVIAEERLLTG